MVAKTDIYTLVLSFCSRLPNRVVDLKSPTVEIMGGVIAKLIGAGLYIMFKDMVIALFRLLDGMIPFRRQVTRLSAA